MMPSNSEDPSLRVLFARALDSASKASNLSSVEDVAQDLIVSSLRELTLLANRLEIAGIFSPNEALEDLPTTHLPYLLVQFVIAEMESRMRTLDRAERMQRLRHSQRHMRKFLDWLLQYEIIPLEQRRAYAQKTSGIADAARRREAKIKQFKLEKELRNKVEAIRKRRGQSSANTTVGDDYNLIATLLQSSIAPSEEDDDEDDEELREIILLVIRLIWTQAQSQLESMDQEMELLQNAPSIEPEPRVPGDKDRDEDRAAWRLDPSMPKGGPDGKGPLMDSSGRPLRPFTILPGSSSSQRSRMQAEVFRPDHRLPTMTMDEYLEEERRRGNIITGGGPQSQEAPTRMEQLTLASEMDGTAESEAKDEEKRWEEERWARYTDLHPKGEGNTMNRG